MDDLAVWLFLFAVYFVPSLVAAGRKHPNSTAIGVLNLMVGWTILGWVVALVWSCTSPALPATSDRALDRQEKACPMCGEAILAVAVKCKHCGSDL